MKKFTDKQKIIIGIIIISFAFGANGMHIKNKNLEIEQAKAELIKKEVELKEAKKPTLLEITQEQIQNTKDQQIEIEELYNKSENDLKVANENLNKAKKYKEANIWFTRCLETEAEMQIKKIKNDLMCEPYVVMHLDYPVLESEEKYKKLQKFASYNFENTREDLGLKK